MKKGRFVIRMIGQDSYIKKSDSNGRKYICTPNLEESLRFKTIEDAEKVRLDVSWIHSSSLQVILLPPPKIVELSSTWSLDLNI